MADLSVSGTKDQVRKQIDEQLESMPVIRDLLVDFVELLPGEQVSMSGNVSFTATGKAGSFTISGSSWSL